MTLRLGFVALLLLAACSPEGPRDRKQAATAFATMFGVAPYMCNNAHDWCTGMRNGAPVNFVCGGGACRFAR